jgi:ubiquitin C-terminal hydrolase
MSNIQGTGGIVNVGFTCYANAVIQAFRQFPKIETLFKEGNYNTILKDGCKYNELTKQFASVVQTLQSIHSNSSVRPMGFWSAFSEAAQNTCFDHLSSREPHDAHEFLMFLLDSLHESLSRTVKMNISKCELKSERQKSHQKSLEAWKENFEKQFSPFVDIFFGLFHLQVMCDECKNVSHKFEPFNTLKGIIPEDITNPTLLECLEGDLNNETIEGYQCDNCKKHTRATRKTRVWKLPQNLIIVLKRFTYDGRKITKPIKPISTILSLESLYSELSPNKKDSNYTVLSTVDHHGSARGGHYTAQGLHNSEHKWYVYDDQSVHSIDNPHFGESTYILFLNKL